MMIRSKITWISMSLVILMLVNIGFIYLGREQLNLVRNNAKHHSERQYKLLTLKSALVYAFATCLEREYASILQGTGRSGEVGDEFEEAMQSAELALENVGKADSLYVNLLGPAFLFTSPDDSEAENDRLRLESIKDISKELLIALTAMGNSTSTTTTSVREKMMITADEIYDSKLSVVIDQAIADEQMRAEQDNRTIKKFYRVLGVLFFVLSFLVIVGSFYLAVPFARSITSRLQRLITAAEHFQKGEFTFKETFSGNDEVAVLGNGFNQMPQEILSKQAALLTSSKMSALGEMAGGIAHEINNPIGIIAARANQVKRLTKMESVDLEKIYGFSDVIEQTAHRIAKIIAGLRSFARNGEKDPFVNASLDCMIQDALFLCSERYKSRGIEVSVTQQDSSLEIECRSTQIVQVLVNLLNNAYDVIEFMENKWIRIETRDLGESVEISITDSGSGIPQHVKEKMFQPFFTTKEVGKGTGLGLSIARGIIEDHGGRIFIDMDHPNTRFVMQLKKSH